MNNFFQGTVILGILLAILLFAGCPSKPAVNLEATSVENTITTAYSTMREAVGYTDCFQIYPGINSSKSFKITIVDSHGITYENVTNTYKTNGLCLMFETDDKSIHYTSAPFTINISEK